MTRAHNLRRYLIFALATAFYFYEYFLRVAPSVMVPELLSAFNANAAAIGTLSAFYFYAYAPMQIPVGVLSDRFGARKLLTLAALVCGLGTILFSYSSLIWIASLSRLLVGTASAFGFVGMLYVVSHWFEEKRRALLFGVGNSFGMLGAVVGQGPLSYAIHDWGWRDTLLILAFFGIALSICIFLVVRGESPEMAKHDEAKKKTRIWHNLYLICKNPQTWFISLVSIGLYMTTVAFAGLWAVPFFEEVYHYSRHEAGFAASMIFVGWIVGGPIVGHISDRASKRKPFLIFSSLIATFVMALLIYYPHASSWLVFLLLFLIGLLSSSQMLTYAFAIEVNAEEAKGTAAAFINCMVFIGGSILQPVIGAILDSSWSGEKIGGTPYYSAIDFHRALICFPAAFLLAFIISFFLKDKKKPHEEADHLLHG